MKKGKFLLVTILVSILMPLCVNAKEAVNVYIFKGKTCGYCAKALEFFNELKEEKDYKDIFNLVEYEIWYNEDNNDLAAAVAEEMGDELDGVPYIVIGEETFSGYSSSMDDRIKKAIKDYYGEENPVDKVAKIKESGDYKGAASDSSSTASGSGEGTNYSKNESKADTVIAIGIIVVAVIGFGYIIYLSRKDTDIPEKKESLPKEKNEEKKIESETKEEKEPSKKQTTPTKKNPTKSKSSTKAKSKSTTKRNK